MMNNRAPILSDAERRQRAVETTRQWRIKNPEKHRALNRAYRERHRDEMRAKGRAYALAHPEERKARKHAYLARKYGADGRYTAQQFREVKALYNNRCAYCGKARPLEADHVTPLARGGSNHIDNILPACRSCNASKNDRTIDEYIGPNATPRKRMPRPDPTMKLCRGCGRTLPFSAYWKMVGVKTGIQSSCKECSAVKHKDYISRNREKRRAYMREWHRKNKPKSS